MALEILKNLLKRIKGLFWKNKPNISKMKDNKDVKGLIKALSYKDESIRLRAIKALGILGDPEAIEPLIKLLSHSFLGNYATFSLGKIGKPAVKPLINALQKDNKNVRINSTYALGLTGDTNAVQTLIQLLDDKNDTVRMNAAAALGMIGSEEAVLSLIKALNDKHWKVRENATGALEQIGDKKAIKPLNHMLNDENKEVSVRAKIALEKIKNKD